MIVYFSGSGNSLAIARQIAQGTGDRVRHLNEAIDMDLTQERSVGLVYPAYSWDAPLLVKSLVPRLSISPSAYVYLVVTCGSTPGNAIPTVMGLLAKEGIRVQYSRIVSVPDSSAICFGNNANEQFGKFDRVPAVVEEIVRDVEARRQSLQHERKVMQANFINSRLFFPVATWLVRQHVNPAKCIGCGICEKVCPCRNITMEERKATDASHKREATGDASERRPKIARPGENCTQCLACVHFCPQQAMEVRHKTMPKALQYHHPDIRVKDMTGVGRPWTK